MTICRFTPWRLRALLARWPNHPKVDLITTDGFLYPNRVLEERGLLNRKGFPESYDLRRLMRFMAELKSGADENVAALVYAGASLAMGIAFNLIWAYVIRHRRELGVEIPDEEIRRISLGFMIGAPIYVVALIVALISPAAVLIIIGAVAVYYMVAGMRSPDL